MIYLKINFYFWLEKVMWLQLMKIKVDLLGLIILLVVVCKDMYELLINLFYFIVVDVIKVY